MLLSLTFSGRIVLKGCTNAFITIECPMDDTVQVYDVRVTKQEEIGSPCIMKSPDPFFWQVCNSAWSWQPSAGLTKVNSQSVSFTLANLQTQLRRKLFFLLCLRFVLFNQNCKLEYSCRPHSHRMHNATQANGTCRQWECSHCMQATSKDLHFNLRARGVPRPVWIGRNQ